VSREAVSRAELHRMFMDELRREAPDSVFVFEIDHRTAGADGCNWYPLAGIGSWQGDLTTNLGAFRRVRDRLAQDYLLDGEPADALALDDAEIAAPA